MAAVSTQPPVEMSKNPDLAELVHNHQASVWRYLRFLGAQAHEADDLTQETFLAVAGSIRQSNFEQRSSAQTAAYLRTVARNQLLMARRKRGHEINTVELEAAESVWAEATAGRRIDDYVAALADCLENGLKQADGRARQAIDQFYRNGQGRAEIAKELNMTPDGVKTLLRRTRDVLRNCIERKINVR